MSGAAEPALEAVADNAAEAAGLRRHTWRRLTGGDSEFAMLPTTEPVVAVVDRYVRELNAELFRHNRRLRTEARLRLRVAIHFGPIARAALVDAAVLRAALAEAEEANLALLLSERVYVDTVASRVTSWRPGQFRQVRVRQQAFDEDAWLWVPNHDVHAMALREPAAMPRRTPSGRSAS
jgi:hypothetical protein